MCVTSVFSLHYCFSHKIKHSHAATNHPAGLLRAARSEDYILGSINRRRGPGGGGQDLRGGGERTAELRNRFEMTNESFSYEDDDNNLNLHAQG